jgi:hypothetical protein
MKKSTIGLTCLAMLAAAAAVEVRGDVVDCLQYPIYYDELGNALWVDDQHDTSTDPSCQAVTETYIWYNATVSSAPEICTECQPRTTALKLKAAETPKSTNQPNKAASLEAGQLPQKLNFGDLFTDHVPAKWKTGPINSMRPDYNPKNAMVSVKTSWVRVQPDVGTAPLNFKLFEVGLDYSAAHYGKNPPAPRTIRVGFEVNSFPTNLPAQPVLITAKQPIKHPVHKTKYGCKIAIPGDPNTKPFTVFANTQVLATAM